MNNTQTTFDVFRSSNRQGDMTADHIGTVVAMDEADALAAAQVEFADEISEMQRVFVRELEAGE